MIKYPVAYRGYFDTVIVVEDSAGNEVCQCPSVENAELIASALNAAHGKALKDKETEEIFRDLFKRLEAKGD